MLRSGLISDYPPKWSRISLKILRERLPNNRFLCLRTSHTLVQQTTPAVAMTTAQTPTPARAWRGAVSPPRQLGAVTGEDGSWMVSGLIAARQSLEAKVPGSTLLDCCGQKRNRGQSVLQKRPWNAAQTRRSSEQTADNWKSESRRRRRGAVEALNVFSWTVPRSASAASCPQRLHQELQQLPPEGPVCWERCLKGGGSPWGSPAGF